MVEQTSAPSLDRNPALANAAQGAAPNASAGDDVAVRGAAPPASAGDDVAVQAEASPRSHRDASLPDEPPAAVEGGADQAGAPSAEPTTTIAIASGLEGARSAHGPQGDDDLEHERVFYLTDEDFVRRQAMVSTVDHHDAEVGRGTPPPPSVAIAHRRRLRRVVAYAMGTALMLCMVGIGHFLGRSLFSAPANAASASRPPPAAAAPLPPSPPAPASPPNALAPASPAKAPAPAPKAPAGHASHDKRGAAEKRR